MYLKEGAFFIGNKTFKDLFILNNSTWCNT